MLNYCLKTFKLTILSLKVYELNPIEYNKDPLKLLLRNGYLYSERRRYSRQTVAPFKLKKHKDPTKHFLISNCRIHLRAETIAGARGEDELLTSLRIHLMGLQCLGGPLAPASSARPHTPAHARPCRIFISKFPLEAPSSLTFTFLCTVA